MSTGATSAVIIGLSKSIDRQQAHDLVEVRAGWTLVAALASGRAMSEKVDRADLLIFEDTLGHADVVMQAVAALGNPPTIAILSRRSPVAVARDLGCAPQEVVALSPGVSLHAAMLRVLAAFEARSPTPSPSSTPAAPREQSGSFRAVSSPVASSDASAMAPARRRDDLPIRDEAAATPKRDLLVIGASTGGPDALTDLLAAIPREFPAPILITQHMPRTFTELLAATLDRATPFTVREAKHGDVATAGCVYIAPGGSHMVITDRRGTIALNDDPPEHNCRPSVDVLFRSAAATFGRSCVAVVLTGRGSDGAIGAARLADLGAHVIAQDRESSVVWGMPRAVAQHGAANEILPLKEIAVAVGRQFERTVSCSPTPAMTAPASSTFSSTSSQPNEALERLRVTHKEHYPS